jgi:hypothetical protein
MEAGFTFCDGRLRVFLNHIFQRRVPSVGAGMERSTQCVSVSFCYWSPALKGTHRESACSFLKTTEFMEKTAVTDDHTVTWVESVRIPFVQREHRGNGSKLESKQGFLMIFTSCTVPSVVIALKEYGYVSQGHGSGTSDVLVR